MAIRRRGERYAVLWRDDTGRQRSRTFEDPDEAEAYDEQTKLQTATCRCPTPRRLRVSQATLDAGAILCATCGKAFTITA